ncbi:hypothetical protein BD408DRAFT_410612 [Parasitella parasitica]|nr:hypothetical protein BD408DRAFT_410612 [Parasitella parasitica]
MNKTTRKQTDLPNPDPSHTFLMHLPSQTQQESSTELISSLLEKRGPPRPIKSKSVGHLPLDEEETNPIELRLSAMEDRLQQLERKNDTLLPQHQPMKPNQQQMHQQHDSGSPHDSVDDGNYKDKYLSLLEMYNKLQLGLRDKEFYYQQEIKRLLKDQDRQKTEEREGYRKENVITKKQNHLKTEENVREEKQEAYWIEDGYIIFFSVGINGDSVKCKARIPPRNLDTPPASITSSPKRGLNPKASIYLPN